MAPRKGPADPLNAKKETLAAVVLADSFTQVHLCRWLSRSKLPGITRTIDYAYAYIRCCLQQFKPITVERAKVLLPVVNVPMIDYTLEWLVAGGVEEVSCSGCQSVCLVFVAA